MTHTSTRQRSSIGGSVTSAPLRGHDAHRAALRAELFRHFFLPTPEETADPSWLSRLEVELDPTLARPPDAERRRIEATRDRVTRFRAVNHPQRQLRCLVLEMLDYMARELLCPGAETALEEWWAAAHAYIRVLELAVMATPRARTLLPKIIDATWLEVEKVATTLARRYGPHPPRTARPAAQSIDQPDRLSADQTESAKRRSNRIGEAPVNQGVIESWLTHNT